MHNMHIYVSKNVCGYRCIVVVAAYVRKSNNNVKLLHAHLNQNCVNKRRTDSFSSYNGTTLTKQKKLGVAL